MNLSFAFVSFPSLPNRITKDKTFSLSYLFRLLFTVAANLLSPTVNIPQSRKAPQNTVRRSKDFLACW